ncbi:MAG: glycosyltransferase family 2 protein [Planctomycetaceae bacterium]
MRYSVVIPAYNALRKLPRAIESCLRQSLPPAEILVVDDASPELPADGLRSLYPAEFATGLLRVIALAKNAGPSTARNTGWEAATGDRIAFLDADDRWDADRLATIAEWLDAEPETDWFAHRYRLPGEPRAGPVNCCEKPIPLSLKRLILGNVAQTSCVVLRASIPLRFDERMRHCEDYDLWLRIAASGYRTLFSETAFTELDRPQLTAGGLSGDRRAMRRGEMRAYRHLAHLRPALRPALPLLYAFSIAKHARRALIWRGRGFSKNENVT